MTGHLRDTFERLDQGVVALLRRHGHRAHRLSVGGIFVWFGLLKPLGHETTTSVLAHTIYWGDPAVMVLVLGWWEVAIGVCILVHRWLRVAVALLLLRVPGILLAFAIEPELLFFEVPFAPTPEGQYLIKDLALFVAALAMASFLRPPPSPEGVS